MESFKIDQPPRHIVFVGIIPYMYLIVKQLFIKNWTLFMYHIFTIFLDTVQQVCKEYLKTLKMENCQNSISVYTNKIVGP